MRAEFARQLSHPDGWRGRVVAALLDRYNRSSMIAAVEAMELSPGATAADLGFGGGAGLGLLLRRVGLAGQVHGVDISATARHRAARRFRREVATGQLQLHGTSMTELSLSDDVLDGAITFNTVYYIAELDRAFGELRRVLNGTGHAVVGLADPEAMAMRSFTQHGLHLRPVGEITADAAEGRSRPDQASPPRSPGRNVPPAGDPTAHCNELMTRWCARNLTWR